MLLFPKVQKYTHTQTQTQTHTYYDKWTQHIKNEI